MGPATGSALLAAFDPSVPYLSDEARNAALGSLEGKDQYSEATWLQLTEALRAKAAELTAKGGSGGRQWAARDVEQCLFAEAHSGGSEAGSKKQGKGKPPAAAAAAAAEEEGAAGSSAAKKKRKR